MEVEGPRRADLVAIEAVADAALTKHPGLWALGEARVACLRSRRHPLGERVGEIGVQGHEAEVGPCVGGGAEQEVVRRSELEVGGGCRWRAPQGRWPGPAPR
jgi:hypothetical protein